MRSAARNVGMPSSYPANRFMNIVKDEGNLMNEKTGPMKLIYLLVAMLLLMTAFSSCSSPTRDKRQVPSSTGQNVNTAACQQSYESVQETNGTGGIQPTADAGGKANDAKHGNITGSNQTAVSAKNTGKQDSTAPKEATNTMTQPGTAAGNGEDSNSVSISITGPEKVGVILKETAVEFKAGDTVLDILRKVTREKNIQMDCRGSRNLAYVRGIANVYEFDYGAESGWIYKVDGKVANMGSGTYLIKKGDIIEWLYTVDMGKEFGGIGGK